MRAVFFLILTIGWVGQAHAHLGHVGELAGHSHWVAVGAAVGAAAIAAWLGKRKLDAEEAEAEQAAEEAGEPAGAEA
ncbi:DUF6732 family protein [Salaquimonas pukyongi]|uniref:DUF6732 family protein n=1 Tax=Salaquimonas pukyongi TaxID=2712698 RepID=UPI00096B751A|nr:DUF6732 family protein [Salaquimonas pukyongi]